MSATTDNAPRLIVFARAPVAGHCKTRLMSRHGARGAARIHRQLSLRTLATAAASGIKVELWCAPDTRHGFFHACRRQSGVTLHRQPTGDLGRKMGRVLAQTLAHGASSAVIIGTDCPTLTAQDLRLAVQALEGSADWVLQPAEDGGYVLIGARIAAPGALRDIAWSSGRERRQTLAHLRARGLQTYLLPPLWDVDYPADLRRARRENLL